MAKVVRKSGFKKEVPTHVGLFKHSFFVKTVINKGQRIGGFR